MRSASWLDPSSFRHFRLALKISCQRRFPAQAIFCFHGSLPHGGEGAFDGVAGADMFPVLGGEIIECQQSFPILDQALRGLVVFNAVSLDEKIKRRLRVDLGFGHPDILEMALGFRLGIWLSTLAVLCTQQRCSRVSP